MTPEEAARELEEELEAALLDLEPDRGFTVQVLEVPGDLGADTHFVVRVGTTGAAATELRAPTPLVMGYLADEEAAVDEWRHWVHGLAERLSK